MAGGWPLARADACPPGRPGARRRASRRNQGGPDIGVPHQVLSLADPNRTIGATVTVAAAIDSAAAWLDRDLAAAPAAHAEHALTGLGHIARADGRPSEAAGHYREVLERRRRSLGAVHPEVANAIINLAGALGQDGQVDASLRLFDEGLEMRRVTQGVDHAEIGVDLVGLGDTQRMAGHSVAAMRTYREALQRLRRTHGAEHPLTREVAGKLNHER
ncbi:MAG: tetratricopeptide repeat protein [Gemmatimonas sp.]|nr:tetratricopeptide repeat protein [Gemmatimonas sp.]